MFRLITISVFVALASAYQNNYGLYGGAPNPASIYGGSGYNFSVQRGPTPAPYGINTQYNQYGQASPYNQGQLASPPIAFNNIVNPGELAVKGFNATQGQFPFVVSLELKGTHTCGGAIISQTSILTGAHCVLNQPYSSLTVLAGTNNRFKGGIRSHVSHYAIHPSFNSQTKNYDIAIVFIKGVFIFGLHIRPINLPKQNEVLFTNARVIISGWGTEARNGLVATNLKYTSVPLMDHTVCKTYFPSVTSSSICVGDLVGRRDSCPGDAGGPLTKDNVLIGVMSWGYGCNVAGKPTVFTYVAGVRDWIRVTARV